MNQNILFHLVLIIALPAFNLSSDELKQSESTLDESNKQTKNEANNGSIAPPAEVRDTEGGEDDQTDGLQGSLTQEQMYRRLFESNRAIQLEAVKSIQEFGDYAQRYKLLTVMLDQLFKVLQEARTNLTQWGYMPGDPFPNNSTIMEAISKVLENTAMFGDMVLRLPDIVHEMYDKDRDWQIVMAWAWWFCSESNIFEGSSAKLLNLMAQEVNLVPKEDYYHNPFKAANQKQEQEKEYTKTKPILKSKKKKERRKGPRLSGPSHTEL